MRRSAAMFGPPSSSSSLVRFWPPPIEKVEVPPLSNGRVLATGLVASRTPAESLIRLDGARPLIGRLSICADSTTTPTDAVPVESSAASPCTVTDSVMFPTSSLRSSVTRWPVLRRTFSRTQPRESLKLGSDRVVARVSGTRRCRFRLASVVATCAVPVSTWVAVTVTPGRMPPCASATRPVSVARYSWACAGGCHAMAAVSTTTVRQTRSSIVSSDSGSESRAANARRSYRARRPAIRSRSGSVWNRFHSRGFLLPAAPRVKLFRAPEQIRRALRNQGCHCETSLRAFGNTRLVREGFRAAGVGHAWNSSRATSVTDSTRSAAVSGERQLHPRASDRRPAHDPRRRGTRRARHRSASGSARRGPRSPSRCRTGTGHPRP